MGCVGATAAEGSPAASSGQRAVALRGELWQRHVQLRELHPETAEYPDAVDQLLKLTAELLRAEAEAAEARRHARRRASRMLYCLAAAAIVITLVLVGLTAPAEGSWVVRWVLVAMISAAVLAVTFLLLRWYRTADAPIESANNARFVQAPVSGEPDPFVANLVEERNTIADSALSTGGNTMPELRINDESPSSPSQRSG
jgi:hypothetical protein